MCVHKHTQLLRAKVWSLFAVGNHDSGLRQETERATFVLGKALGHTSSASGVLNLERSLSVSSLIFSYQSLEGLLPLALQSIPPSSLLLAAFPLDITSVFQTSKEPEGHGAV